jgi:hypothetical protein
MVPAQRLCDALVRRRALHRGIDPLILSIGGGQRFQSADS